MAKKPASQQQNPVPSSSSPEVTRNSVKNVLDHVIIDKARIDVNSLKRNIEDAKKYLSTPSRSIVLADRPCKVDYALLLDSLTTMESILADRSITARDVFALPSFVSQYSKEDEEARLAPHYSYVAFNQCESRHWPVDKAMPGIVPLLGDTGSGKTYFIRHTIGCDVIIRYTEPMEDVDYEEYAMPADSLFSALNSAAVLSLMGGRVAVDSLRSLVYGLKGNPMEGGMIAAIFDLLTQINNLFADMGITSIMAINPMLADETKADRLYNRIASSTAGAIYLRNRGEIGGQTYRLTDGRTVGATPTGRMSSHIEGTGGDTGPRAKDPLGEGLSANHVRHPFVSLSRGLPYALDMGKLEDTQARERLGQAYNNGLSEEHDQGPRPAIDFQSFSK